MNEPSTTTVAGEVDPGGTTDHPTDFAPASPGAQRRPADRRPGRMGVGMQAALNREWAQRYARGMVAVPPSWRRDDRLARYRLAADALAELDGADTPPGRAEEVARALAEAAAAGDELAGRVVLQHILPSLAGLAWGYWLRAVPPEERRDLFNEMVSTVWLSLATGDALRGEIGVRKRLFRDVEYRVLQRPRRRQARERRALMASRRTACSVADITGRPETAAVPAGEELLEVVCDALGQGLRLRDAQVMTDLGTASNARFAVQAVTEASKVDPDGVTTRCIRYRRANALRRLRAVAVEAA